ncbi:hypothetical protein SRABI70_04616 [Pseudomonas sp. Bi70]|nr:hypothetical protein SRABI70_04616 [Pseudomonas sp. Bi70]
MDTAEADIDTTTFEGFHLGQGGQLGQAQFDGGLGAQLADQLRQCAIQRRGCEADTEPAPLPFGDAPGVIADAAQLLEQLHGMFIEEPPGLGQAQRPAALDQGHAQLVFQLLDLPAQRRLGDM